MPLYADDRQSFVRDGFRAAVLRAVLYNLQAGTEAAYGLVMGAVDDGLLSVEGVQPGGIFDYGIVIFIAVIIPMTQGSFRWEILYDFSAQAHIDNLHTLADAQHRFMLRESQLKSLQLPDIQFCINITGSMVAFSEEGGGDVASSGEQQCAAGGEGLRRQGD